MRQLHLQTEKTQYFRHLGSAELVIYMIVIPLITFAAFIWDGIYIGATASKAIRNTMIIATIFVFMPSWYLLTPKFGNHGLWMAFMCFMIARGVAMTFMAKKNIIQTV